MLSRTNKQLFYSLAGPLMRINGWFFRNFRVTKLLKNSPLRLHLGPGQKAYLPGWINIDANAFTAKCELWFDLSNPLPFPEQSVDAVYSHHMIEHLSDIEAHFRDVFRVLKAGGYYRVGGPNGDKAIQKFIEMDHEWFNDWPDKYESIGGRFANFILCRNEHLMILTESYLREMAERAGFREVTCHLPVMETRSPELFGDCLRAEHERTPEAPHTLILELRKAS